VRGARGYTASSDCTERAQHTRLGGPPAGRASGSSRGGSGRPGEGGGRGRPPATSPAAGPARPRPPPPPSSTRCTEQAAQGHNTPGQRPRHSTVEHGKHHSSRGGISTRGWVNMMLTKKESKGRRGQCGGGLYEVRRRGVGGWLPGGVVLGEHR
jgi:hypothetical protein